MDLTRSFSRGQSSRSGTSLVLLSFGPRRGIPYTVSLVPAKSIVFMPRVCCWEGLGKLARGLAATTGLDTRAEVKERFWKDWEGIFCLEAARTVLANCFEAILSKGCIQKAQSKVDSKIIPGKYFGAGRGKLQASQCQPCRYRPQSWAGHRASSSTRLIELDHIAKADLVGRASDVSKRNCSEYLIQFVMSTKRRHPQ